LLARPLECPRTTSGACLDPVVVPCPSEMQVHLYRVHVFYLPLLFTVGPRCSKLLQSLYLAALRRPRLATVRVPRKGLSHLGLPRPLLSVTRLYISQTTFIMLLHLHGRHVSTHLEVIFRLLFLRYRSLLLLKCIMGSQTLSILLL
jgi:hypothetical protein